MSETTDPLLLSGAGEALVHIEIADLGALWTRHADLTEEVLSLYEPLTQTLREDHGGQPVPVAGDGALFVFRTVDPALMWCMRMQEALLSAAWPPGLETALSGPSPGQETVTGGLMTHVGIHLGDATDWADRQRAARLSTLAQSGQVLVTQPAWSAAEMPARQGVVVVQDAGTAVLHTGDRSMPIVQALPRSLSRRRFHPLQSALTPRSNLWAPADAFVGRTSAMEALEERFESGGRLVTLVGQAGLGKTRLAREFASRHRAGHPGGVWVVPVGRCHTAADLFWAVATVLGISRKESPLSIVERIGQALRGLGRALIVLDGVDIPDASQPIGAWVRGAPEARFIVTTRTVLDLEWETRQPFGPMAPADAATLLRARAQRIARGGPSRLPEALVQQLADLTGGSPLSIELMAAQLVEADAETVAERVLQTPLSDPNDPGKAIVAALWNHMDGMHQAILTAMAAHPGDISGQALIRVVVDGTSDHTAATVADAIDALVARGIVHWSPCETAVPTLVLADPIRVFVAQHREDAEQVHQRIRDNLLVEVERLPQTTGDPVDVPTLRAMLQHVTDAPQTSARLALAIHRASAERGLGSDDAAMLDQGVASAQASEDRGLEVHIRIARARLLCDGDQDDTARADLDAAAALATDLGPLARASVQRAEGAWHRNRGQADAAISVLEAAIAALTEAGVQEPALLADLGAAYREAGRTDDAVNVLTQAIDATPSAQPRCSMLTELGRAQLDAGQVDPAARAFERAIDDAETAQSRRQLTINRSLLAEVALLQGRPDTAATLYRQNVDALTTAGHRQPLAEVRANLGDLYLGRYDLDASAEEYGHALVICRELDLPGIEAHVLAHLGVVARAQGDIDAALDNLAGAAALARAQDNPRLEAFVRAHRGAVEAAWDRMDAAEEEFEAAQQCAEQDGDTMTQVILDVMSGFMDLASARDAAASDSAEVSQKHIQDALSRLARGSSHESRVAPPRGNETPGRLGDLRVALRLLDTALASIVPHETPPD
jgi:tetratricopeptide (TPR) repeat protein